MELGLKGRAAIVTGASAGIGKAVAAALAGEGVDVAIAARDPDRLSLAAQEIHAASGRRILPIPTDMTKRDQIDSLVDRAAGEFRRLDILVNNAGASKMGDPLELGLDAYEETMRLKYMGYVCCAHAAAKHMIEQGWGRIINVIGVGGMRVIWHRKGGPGGEVVPPHIPGGASNAALILFTKGLGLRLASHGVLVNAVSPGPVATERNQRLVQTIAATRGVSYADAEREFLQDVAIGRRASPQEVADTILFLASERASYFVGANLSVDGGSTNAI